jgi:glycine/D-amino acid oxidase-like deaminating enzyme
MPLTTRRTTELPVNGSNPSALSPGSHIECRWVCTFDSTHDGLPPIGAVPDAENLFAAYDYGGNGITFS